MEKKKVSVETVVRTIVLVVTLLNQVLTMLGKNPLPFAEDELYSMLTAAATVAATLWAWWSYVKKKYKLNVTNFLPFVDSFA